MMKSICFSTVLIFLNIYASSKDYHGFFIDKMGNKVETIFDIPQSWMTNEPNFIKIESEIKYTDNEIDKKLRPGMCQKVVFFMDETEITLIPLRNKYKSGSGDSIFLRPKIIGPASLYYFYFYSQSYGANGIPSGRSISEGWIIEKDNGQILKVTYGGAKRNDLANIFYDYKEFAEKIINKEIDGSDIRDTEKMVRIYNDWRSIQIPIKSPDQSIDTIKN